MIETLVKNLEETEVSIIQWIISFVGIIFVRFFLEQLSLPSTSGIIASDSFTLIHYGLFYITAIIGLIYIVGIGSGGNYRNLFSLALFCLPIIWIAPITDLIVSLGHGFAMSYIITNPSVLFFDFLTFFGPHLTKGVTVGIRLEIILILYSIFWYVKRIKSTKKAFLTVFYSYIFLFSILTLPSIIYAFALLFHLNKNSLDILSFYKDIFSVSTISFNIIHSTLLFGTLERFFELAFDKFMSQLFFILAFIFTTLLFWKTWPTKFIAVIKNSRLERIIHYYILLIFGLIYALASGHGHFSSWVDIFGILSLFLSWYGSWMFAVHINDIADVSIDTISNVHRPLIQNAVTTEEMRQTAFIWLIVSLTGSWAAGYYPFFMNLVFTACYFIYSSEIVRFKRVPILSSFLISIACLSSVYAGFFFLSFDKTFRAFSPVFTLGIIVIFTLASNIRDLKDIEGDTENNIRTLPVIFGEKKGKLIVGILLALSFLIIPLFFSLRLFIFSIPASFIGFKLATKTPYKEKNIFLLYFLYVVSGSLVFFIL